MNLQEILSLTDKDSLNLSITQLTKKLGVSGLIITDELKKHDFKYQKESGEILYNNEVVKVVKSGSNTERLKKLYVFIAEVNEVLRVVNDKELKRSTEINYEEEVECSLGLDSVDVKFILDSDTKTYTQIESQVLKYFKACL